MLNNRRGKGTDLAENPFAKTGDLFDDDYWRNEYFFEPRGVKVSPETTEHIRELWGKKQLPLDDSGNLILEEPGMEPQE
jgi:hypothetical protein